MASKEDLVQLLHALANTIDAPKQQFAQAALEFATDILNAPTTDTVVPKNTPEDIGYRSGKQYSEEPYTGSIHLCLDFGTAMSKACAWDKDSDIPMPLKIGEAAGEAASPYALNSTIFISRDGVVFFGQKAVEHAAAVDAEKHTAFQSIKDIITVKPKFALSEPVDVRYNPSECQVSYKEVIAFYLAFLTDNALLALKEEYQEDSRNIPRSYTKPVFDQKRDKWAKDILSECASIGQALADRFSSQWADGISLRKLTAAVTEARYPVEDLVVESGVIPEPIAAFASRTWKYSPQPQRRLMMVVDVGAGTTDFAMFTILEQQKEMRLFRVANSVTTIRCAGDAIDNELVKYFLHKAGISDSHSQVSAIQADLRRDIRLTKEELFEKGSVTRVLVNDLRETVLLDDFEEFSPMIRLREALQDKFKEVLSNIDSSWLCFRELQVIFTGGGASLNMVTRLAENQPIWIESESITPRAVKTPPSWLEDEYEEVVAFFPQLAVGIGGACHGAERTDLGLDRELDKFMGDLPDAQWEPEVVRKGH